MNSSDLMYDYSTIRIGSELTCCRYCFVIDIESLTQIAVYRL